MSDINLYEQVKRDLFMKVRKMLLDLVKIIDFSLNSNYLHTNRLDDLLDLGLIEKIENEVA